MKSFKLLTALLALGLIFGACKKEDDVVDGVKAGGAKGSSIVWYGASDIAVKVDIAATQSYRPNASGPKITSNAHSADFPGIYFIWDSKQKDNGYLKVAGWVFDTYESFVLTSKEANTFWDFPIALQDGQEMTNDGCYVFFIPRAQNNKNINMVFVSEFVEKPEVDNLCEGLSGEELCDCLNAQLDLVETGSDEWYALVDLIDENGCDENGIPSGLPVEVNLGFIGYYLYEGKVLSTSFYWQKLNEGDCIDWVAVDAAYAGWVAQGGLEPERKTWKTSGYGTFYFNDYATMCHGDFTPEQIESYYLSYYVSPGYILPNNDETINLEFFEHQSGGQYGYVGLSYTNETGSIQLITLAGADYNYVITSRKPWDKWTVVNNEAGILRPVIGSMNPVFNVLGDSTYPGQQTLRRAGYYVVKGTHKTTGETIIINITIKPSVHDQN